MAVDSALETDRKYPLFSPVHSVFRLTALPFASKRDGNPRTRLNGDGGGGGGERGGGILFCRTSDNQYTGSFSPRHFYGGRTNAPSP